ncbi:MAG: metalloregulator ArsR/SmtB family transcription factor [candidate division KSB1 bacterium]|nr:metalloregulator ArsR/SmtB family transcription factor [candidate division KSB1 bacterium]
MAKPDAKKQFQEFFPESYIKKSVKILKFLSEESRLRIMLYLAKEGPCTVSEIVEALDLVQSTTSHHLSLLRAADLVLTSRDGKNVYYDINEPMWKEMGLQFFKYLQKGNEIDFLGKFVLKVIKN